MQEINANIEVTEDAHNDADNEDTEAEKEEESADKPKEKLSAVEFVNQVCANHRCLSAGYKRRKEKGGVENLRRGSNGYYTASEAKERLVTPASLGEAITNVIQKLEENIEELKVNHEMTIKQLETDTANKFQQFSEEQAKTIMKISQNISDAEGETNRIKEQHEELDEISKKHELFIKELTDNLDRISVENKQSVESLLSNLEAAKKENEIVLEKHNAAITELKEMQEQSVTDLKMDLENAKKLSETFKSKTEEKEASFEEENIELRAKLDYHEIAIKALQNTLETVTEKNNDMHSEIRATHKKSIGDLRQEVFSQVMVVKEVSQGVQEEFNDKLENLTSILNDESSSNKQKIEEIREALDGVDMDIKAKMEETTSSLMSKIHSEVKQNGEGKYGIDLEISVVKDMLEPLSNRVSTMNEKMYDFEANKRNNLIFYGIPNDPNESSESLVVKMQGLLKEKLLLKREIPLTQALRDDTGPAVSGRRPVIVTFENFKDRDSVLRRAPVLKKSGLHVTEDLSKSVREVRANLTKFMRTWKKQNPESYCHLQFDKLYIDNRLYVWDKESGEVVEQEGDLEGRKTSTGSRPPSSLLRPSRPSSSLTRLSGSRPGSSAMTRSSSNASLQRPRSVRLPRTMSVECVTGNEVNGILSRGTSMEDTRHAGCLPSIPGAHKPRSPVKATQPSWQKVLQEPFRL